MGLKKMFGIPQINGKEHPCHPRNRKKHKIGESQPKLAWAESETLSPE
jgi:hypothetical protein